MYTRVLTVELHHGIAELLEYAVRLFEDRDEMYVHNMARLEEVKEQLHRWHVAHVPLPDLLLLDISLREREGRALLDALSKWWPASETRPTIIVMTTGQACQKDYPVPVLHLPFRIHELHRLLYGSLRQLPERSQQ